MVSLSYLHLHVIQIVLQFIIEHQYSQLELTKLASQLHFLADN